MPEPILALVDDPVAIPDDTPLYRKVSWDKIGGSGRCAQGETAELNGNCFTDYPADRALEQGFAGPCMSVAAGNLLPADTYPTSLLDGLSGVGLAMFSAGEVRNLKGLNGEPCPHGVMHAKTEAEAWHAVVFDLRGTKRTASGRKAIAAIAVWVVPLVGGADETLTST